MHCGFALFAAANWVEVVIPIVVFSIWVINQIAGAKKAAQQRQANRPKPPAAAGGQQAGGRRGLMDEVEQFLRDARKAMEEQQQKPQQRPQPAQPARRPQQQRPQKTKQPRQTGKQQPGKPAGRVPLSEQARLQSSLADRTDDDVHRGGSVAEHVKQHFDTSRFDERAGRLSNLRQTVDTDIGSHVREAFDHKLGSLAQQADANAPVAAGASPAEQIVAMLRDPAGMRNAIILQEILSPPSHRW